MVRFVVHWFAVAIALAITAWLLPGVSVSDPASLALGALSVGLVNALVRPLLATLAFPLTVLTLGLFYLVVNAAAFMLAAWFVEGFAVAGWGWAILGALCVSVLSGIVEGALSGRDR